MSYWDRHDGANVLCCKNFSCSELGPEGQYGKKQLKLVFLYEKKSKKFQPKSSSQNDDVIAAYFFHEILLMKVAFRGGGGLKLT